MSDAAEKRARVGRAEWTKRVQRWRESGQTTAEFAAELGINSRTLTYWAWALKREASGKRRGASEKPGPAGRRTATVSSGGAAFVEVRANTSLSSRFELEIRGRRLHIPERFDAQQLRLLLEVLETA